MDVFTKNILTEWGFEDMIAKFNEEEIGHEEFLTLTELMIRDLIPKIGRRSTFCSKFAKFKENLKANEEVSNENIFTKDNPGLPFSEYTITDNVESIDIQNLPFEVEDLNSSILTPSSLIMYNSDTKIDESIPGSSNLAKVIPVIDPEKGKFIREVLNKYQDGIMVLGSYKTKGFLNNSTRNTLASVLIKHALQTDPNHQISKSTFLSLAEGIEMIFPTESKDTYYTPYCRNGQVKIPVRGKLYDKFCNLKKEIKKIETSSIVTNVVNDDGSIEFDDADYEDRIQWLKNNVEPEHILFKYWQETSSFRIKKGFLETHSYPALKKPTGYLLIEIDFEILYPDKKLLLFTKFDGFITKLLQYIEKHNIQFGVQENLALQELKTPSKSGNDTIAALRLIPYLFQPITLKLNKKRKTGSTLSTWRPSKVEQASAFMKFIDDANELKTSHTQKIEKSIQFGTTLQPYVIIVGYTGEAYQDHSNAIESYTVINNTYYKLETPLKALDVCFKSYYSLNLQYPLEVQQVWTFIQQYFFEIHDKNDKNFPSVKTLINDLNQF